MIPLRGRTRPFGWDTPLFRAVWALSTTTAPARPEEAFLVDPDQGPPPSGYDLYVFKSPSHPGDPDAASLGQRSIVLPAELDYLQAGDVIGLSPDGTQVDVLWRSAAQNSILLTEQCDNYCLMCSQPPRDRDDSWLFDRAARPTLAADRFLALLDLTARCLPTAEIHILSNGRRFAESDFTEAYAALNNPRMMVGIPLYGTEPGLHDYVVQARGAFDQTMRGILNLASWDQRIEIRVVLHRQTAPVIVDIAEYIARNIPFVEQVALMGLEIMGLARANLSDAWIDPFDTDRTSLKPPSSSTRQGSAP